MIMVHFQNHNVKSSAKENITSLLLTVCEYDTIYKNADNAVTIQEKLLIFYKLQLVLPKNCSLCQLKANSMS